MPRFPHTSRSFCHLPHPPLLYLSHFLLRITSPFYLRVALVMEGLRTDASASFQRYRVNRLAPFFPGSSLWPHLTLTSRVQASEEVTPWQRERRILGRVSRWSYSYPPPSPVSFFFCTGARRKGSNQRRSSHPGVSD